MGIFNNPYNNTETWSAQGALMSWNGAEGVEKGAPMLILQVTAQFSRRIQSFYPIVAKASARKKINMTGAPVGQLTIGGIFSPDTKSLKSFIEAVGAPCKKDPITCTITPFGDDCDKWGDGTRPTITLSGIELESVGIQIQGGEVAVVNFPTTYSFTDMDFGTHKKDADKNKQGNQPAAQGS